MATSGQVVPAFVTTGPTPQVATLDLNGDAVTVPLAAVNVTQDTSTPSTVNAPSVNALNSAINQNNNVTVEQQINTAVAQAVTTAVAQLQAASSTISAANVIVTPATPTTPAVTQAMVNSNVAQALAIAASGNPTVAAPSVGSTPTVGTPVTLTMGTATGASGHAVTVYYQVFRQTPAGVRTAIQAVPVVTTSAGTPSYTPVAADFGNFLQVVETAVDNVNGNTAFNTSVLSAAVAGTVPTFTVAGAITPASNPLTSVALSLSPPSGTASVANCTFQGQFYINGNAFGSGLVTYTAAAPLMLPANSTQTGDVVTAKWQATSPLGVVGVLTAASNSVTMAGTAAVVVSVSPPMLVGTTSGGSGGIGIVQAAAIDSNGTASTTQSLTLGQAAASGDYRFGIICNSTNQALSSVVASPNSVAWNLLTVTDDTGGAGPNTIQAYAPAAFTNFDTSVLATAAAATNWINFYVESGLIDTTVGLVQGAKGFAALNPSFTWASPGLSLPAGNYVIFGIAYTGGGSNLGFNNGNGPSTAITGNGITAGSRNNVGDGDCAYVQWRTLTLTTTTTVTEGGGFPGSGGGGEDCWSMILAFKQAAGSTTPPFTGGTAVQPHTLAHQGTALDLSGYALTFNDAFASSEIVAASNTSGVWFAPGAPNYGLAPFQGPGSTYPWTSGDQQILLQWTGSAWTGGEFQSVNQNGVGGFSQALGYFEATMKLDKSNGTWPAFWLLGIDNLTNPTGPHCEIDALEFYGEGADNLIYTTGHVYTPGAGTPEQNDEYTFTASSDLSAAYHRYGVLVTTQWVINYFDGLEVCRWPAWAESQKPLYMLLSHALHVDPSPDHATRTLNISAVKVYAATQSGNTVQSTQSYAITPDVDTVNGSTGSPASETFTLYNDKSGSFLAVATVANGVLKTPSLDPVNFPAGSNLKVVGNPVFSGVSIPFSTPLPQAIAYKIGAAPATLSLVANTPIAPFTVGVAAGPITLAHMIGGSQAGYTYAISGMPSTGWTFDTTACAVTCTPTATASIVVTLSGHDSAGNAAVPIQVTLTVNPATASIPFISWMNAAQTNAQNPNHQIQVLGIYPPLNTIPESGEIGSSSIATYGSLRFGRVPDPVNPSRMVYQLAVSTADPTTANAPRVDFQCINGNVSKDTPYAVCMELYISADMAAATNENMTLAAIHTGSDTGSANWEVQMNGGVIQIAQTTDSGTVWFNVGDPGSVSPSTIGAGIAASPRPGVGWHKVIMQFRLNANGTNAYNKCTWNGNLVWSLAGVPNTVTLTGDYCKFGLYCFQLGGSSNQRGTYKRSWYFIADIGYSVAQLQAVLV